jgi:hypothetical protein
VQVLQPGQLAVEIGKPARDGLRLLLVLPQAGLAGSLAEPVGLLPHGVRAEDSFHTVEFR